MTTLEEPLRFRVKSGEPLSPGARSARLSGLMHQVA